MVQAKIDVEVSGAQRTIRQIKRDLHRGMEQSVDTLVSQARSHARGVISEERAIFNSEVYSGFRDAETKNTSSQVSAKLYNDVEHAEVLEEGATFPAEGPPVAALLPWVARKMQWGSSFEPDIYGGSDYFDGGPHDDDDGGSDDDGGGGGETNFTEEVEEVTDSTLEVDLDNVFGSEDIYLTNRQDLFKNFKRVYGNDAISFYSDIEDWKSGGSKDLLATSSYSKKLKTALGIDASIRGDPSEVTVTQNDLEIAKTLNQLSRNFLKKHYDSDDDGKILAHRTLRDESPRLSKEIWNNPDQNSWEIETNAVNNYTTTASNLEGFDRSLFHSKEFDIEDDVLIAVDALIHSDWDREGEIHIRGDYNTPFSGKDLEFQSSSYSDSVDFLTDQFFERGNFGPFTDDQLGAIASTVREMGKSGVALNSEDGVDRIHGFVDEFVERGLHDNTNYSKEQWRDWESIISGDGETLEFDGRVRSYPEGWNTYDPTTVESVPLQETYDTQRVELLNLKTENVIEGQIKSRDQTKNEYLVETEFGDELQITKPQDSDSDDYKIIAAKGWRKLDADRKTALIRETIDEADFRDFSNDNRVEDIKAGLRDSAGYYKKKKEIYDIIHSGRFNWEEKNDTTLASHVQRATGLHKFKITDKAQHSTIFHETIHGSHNENGFDTDRYPPRETNELHYNVFDSNGDNKTTKSWSLSQVLLSKGFDDPPGINDDGSIPEVIQKRVENPSPYEYEDVEDTSAFLNPIEGGFEVGDRIDLDTPMGGRQKAELVDVSQMVFEDVDYEGEKVTLYEIDLMTETGSQTIEIWADDNGDLVNMRGVQIYQKADQPDETVDQTIPDIELEEEGYARVVEAANIAFTEMVWTGAVMKDDGKEIRADSIPFIGRPYSARAANETLTTVSELMTMNFDQPEKPYHTEAQLELLMDKYPYLVEAWLGEYNPSSKVAEYLNKNGYDI